MSDRFGTEGGGAVRWGPREDGDGVIFSLWAPNEKRLTLKLGKTELAMSPQSGGWFDLRVPAAELGDGQYQFVLSDGLAVGDPASRSQVSGADGPSRFVRGGSYSWTTKWQGRVWEDAVICELHIGTFTKEGTFRAAIDRLQHLAQTGFTAIEIMPVAHFAGERGWGYDGVLHYAPHAAYGTPDDMKAFIDAAHGYGMMVLLDVVYNHFGPEGNYLPRYAPAFFRKDIHTPWGAAIDYSQPAVRRYFIDNATYWIGEFQLDGLRLDAIEQIYDGSSKHILTELAEAVHEAFPDRHVHLVVEDQRNDTGVLARNDDGTVKTYSAEWNDDFHHVAHVIATDEKLGHYKTFSTNLDRNLAKTLADGFIYANRGAPSASPLSGAGTDISLPPTSFINFLQNHDQIGNRAFGERLVSLADDDLVRMLTAIMLLSPQIPFLFMGEEFGETQPFFFFCDYVGELGEMVRKGRAAEAEGFGGMKKGKTLEDLPDPNAKETFDGSKLRWERLEGEREKRWQQMVRELLALRRRYVIPLLKSGQIQSEVRQADDGVVRVSWRSRDYQLELCANLSGNAKTVSPSSGTAIFSTGPKEEDETTKLPPRRVIVGANLALENASP